MFKYNRLPSMFFEFSVYFFWLSTVNWSFIEAIQVLYCYFNSLGNPLNITALLVYGWGAPLFLVNSWFYCRIGYEFDIDIYYGWPNQDESCDWYFISLPICLAVLVGVM